MHSLIKGDNEVAVFGGLCALRAFVKKFEYGDKDSRGYLNWIAEIAFNDLE